MAATRNDIAGWLREARAQGATHMIVVCDTFDWDDFPVFVMPDEDVREVEARLVQPNGSRTTYGGGTPVTTAWSSQRVMEVYSMRLTDEEQLRERRAFHYD